MMPSSIETNTTCITALSPSSKSEVSSTNSSSASLFVGATLVLVGLLSTSAAWAIVQRHRQRVKKEYEKELQDHINSTESVASLLLTSSDDQKNKCIYLDYNGTTPIREEVANAMLPYLTTHFGNPSSSHFYGKEPKDAVRRARYEIATSLLHDPHDSTDEMRRESISNAIIFTGCGTEADNMAIHFAILAWKEGYVKGDDSNANGEVLPHIVTCNVEHPAIAECLKFLEQDGKIETTLVKVDEEGLVSAASMIRAIQSNTCLVTLMLANNESGAIMPVAEVAKFCRSKGILFHTDAAQAVGKIDTTLSNLLGDADLVTLVGHKFGAPKGVAALYVRPGCLQESGRKVPKPYGTSGLLLLGGGQEMGRRAGTENVPYIVGMGKAATLASGPNVVKNATRMEHLRARLIENLTRELGAENIRVNGPRDRMQRLPNTASIGIRNVQSGELLKHIGDDVAASAGSACHASGGNISSVLLAMNVPMSFAKGTIRLSVGVGTTESDVDAASTVIAREVRRQWESEAQ